jgi:hypothetical protein
MPPPAEAAADPLADYQPAFDADPGLRPALEKLLGTSSPEQLGAALRLTDDLMQEFGDDLTWAEIERLGTSPALIRLGHQIGQAMRHKDQALARLEAEVTELRAQLAHPDTLKRDPRPGQDGPTTELEMDLAEEKLYAAYFAAQSDTERTVAQMELLKFQRSRYSAPGYRRPR